MTTGLVALALLMAAATYPSRALPLLAPGVDRLPASVLAYLRLVGPATLAALAAVNTLIVDDANGRPSFQLGLSAIAVTLCLGVVAWRKSLVLGVAAAVILVAVARANGVA